MSASGGCPLRQLGEQPALADAGLARHERHTPPARRRVRQMVEQRRQLPLPAEARHRVPSPGRCLRPPFPRPQRRILDEDRRLKPPHLRPGIHPELVGQHHAQPPARLQRLTLPPVAVQRDHELRPPPLPQRRLGDQLLALRDGVAATPHGQDRGHPLLCDRRAQLVEPGRFRTRERTVRELRERRTPPERERLVEGGDRSSALAPLGEPATLRDQRTRRGGIGGEPFQHVTRWAGDDRGVPTALDAPPQPQHVVLQCLRGRPRRRARPERLDQPILGDHRTDVQGEHGQQAALLGPAELHLAAGSDQAHGSEDPNQRPHQDRITTAQDRVQEVGLPPTQSRPRAHGRCGHA